MAISPLDEGALELIGDRLQQIAHHGPAAGLHEHFRGHARDELQPASRRRSSSGSVTRTVK